MISESLLNLENVTKSFSLSQGLLAKTRGRVRAVNDVSLTLETGETLGLVGESGCGKTTIARLILCLDTPDSGQIFFKGRNIAALKGADKKAFRKNVQIIFQDPFSSLNPRKKVGSIIGEPLRIHNLVPSSEVADRVMEIMERVGIPKDNIGRYPHEFSSGQRQRIGVARALSLSPQIIVADEPVSALDVSIQAQTLNLLKELQEQMSLTYLFISHDLSVVRYVSTRVAVMYLGKIVETAAVDDVYSHPLHPYTEALLSAVPHPDPDHTRSRIMLQGEPPSPLDLPAGCVFSPRCPCAEQTICFEKQPPLELKRARHRAACWLRS